MAFEYIFNNKEANFAKPLRKQVKGGTHITFEIILKKGNNYIGLRRRSIPGHEEPPHMKQHPEGLLFFCHNLIRYGESIEKCVKRIVKAQAGVTVKRFDVVYIDSSVQRKDGQWAFTPHIIAEVNTFPKKGKFRNELKEVVLFTKKNIPKDFAWWSRSDLKEFLEEFD